MAESGLIGGSQADRERILELHGDYIDANASFDLDKLDPLWSKAPEAVFFNLNGHTYKGRDHWFRLWRFYKQNVNSSYWTPFDLGGVVSDDMAVVWCHRRTRRNWTGKEPPPNGHPLWRGRIHDPFDHGVSQGGRRLGASCMRIFPRRTRVRAPAVYDALFARAVDFCWRSLRLSGGPSTLPWADHSARASQLPPHSGSPHSLRHQVRMKRICRS